LLVLEPHDGTSWLSHVIAHSSASRPDAISAYRSYTALLHSSSSHASSPIASLPTDPSFLIIVIDLVRLVRLVQSLGPMCWLNTEGLVQGAGAAIDDKAQASSYFQNIPPRINITDLLPKSKALPSEC
jgi:hypothetical protein